MRHLSLITFLAILLAGCSPTLSPLYRDYEVREPGAVVVDGSAPTEGPTNDAYDPQCAGGSTADCAEATFIDDAELHRRIEQGLRNAGWTITESVTDNVVTAEAREFREWGIYSVEVELEVAPVGGDYVRLMVHPFRKFFTGKRRKIGYLRGSLARAALKDLHASFEEQGLHHIGYMQSRDREALQRK